MGTEHHGPAGPFGEKILADFIGTRLAEKKVNGAKQPSRTLAMATA